MLYLGKYVLSEICKVRGFVVWSENIIYRVQIKYIQWIGILCFLLLCNYELEILSVLTCTKFYSTSECKVCYMHTTCTGSQSLNFLLDRIWLVDTQKDDEWKRKKSVHHHDDISVQKGEKKTDVISGIY